MPSQAIPVDYDPFAMVDTPGSLPLTSQDQASRFMDKAGQVATSIADPFMNLATLAGRAAYGPESAGWGRYGPATPEDAAKGALLVTMPALGRAAVAGGVSRDLMSMGGAVDKAPSLVVARRKPDGSILMGKPGEVHSDLMSTRELSASSDTPDIAASMGYADPHGRFLTRQEAFEFAQRHEPGRAAWSAQQPQFGLDAASYNEAMQPRAVPVDHDPFQGGGVDGGANR